MMVSHIYIDIKTINNTLQTMCFGASRQSEPLKPSSPTHLPINPNGSPSHKRLSTASPADGTCRPAMVDYAGKSTRSTRVGTTKTPSPMAGCSISRHGWHGIPATRRISTGLTRSTIGCWRESISMKQTGRFMMVVTFLNARYWHKKSGATTTP